MVRPARSRVNHAGIACIDTSCYSGTSTLETYYSNFIARQLYAQKVPEVQEESILAGR